MSALIKWYLFYNLLTIVSSLENSKTKSVYKIEGKIIFPPNTNALHETRILINEGEFIGIPHIDGYFEINGIPSGSYTVSISSPRHIFESVRVDINKNGNIRARKLDLVDTRKVILVKYPLTFESYTVPKYFEKSEVFHIMDFISHPILLLVVITLVIFFFDRILIPRDPRRRPAV